MTAGSRVRREWLGVLMVWLAAMLIAFRDPVWSGFDLGFGDRADGIIEISLLEHWRNVLTGHSVWNAPIYFHPHSATLGYNDGYFLYGLVYSFWRMWFDPFLSDMLNAASFKTVGFLASWWLVRRTLGWQAPVALLVAALFTIANGMTLQAVHAQLQTVALFPLAMILAIAAVRAEAAGRHWCARLAALGLCLLVGAWLLTAFYTAWFAIWFGCMFVLCWLISTRNWRPAALARLLRPHLATIAWTIAAFGLAAAPFLLVYLPKVGETGGHSYMISYLASPIDPVNVGPGNLVWGWVFAQLDALAPLVYGPDPRVANRLFRGEHQTGFAFALFALFIIAAWRTLRDRAASDQDALARTFAWTVVVTWLLTIKLWVISAWIAVHYLVPGASGIRVVVRYQLILILPVLLVTAGAFRHRLTDLIAHRWVLAAALVGVLLVEQINTTSVAEVSRARQRADLLTIAPPPPGCTSFYAVQTRIAEIPATNPSSPIYQRPENAGKYLHNVDAMLLAQLWRVPTLGGYSTFQPRDWAFADPLAPDYDARVRHYVASHRLTGVCRLDVRDARPWSRIG